MLPAVVCVSFRCVGRLQRRQMLGKIAASVMFQRRASFRDRTDADHAGTMAEVKNEITRRLGLDDGYHPIPPPRDHLLKYQPELKDLPPRSMKDSFTSATIPLSCDTELQNHFVSQRGNVRIGKLLEEVDMFAVWICHKHVLLPALPEGVHLPYTFVTLLVDKVMFSGLTTMVTEDVRISGHVSWVGRTSIEIAVWLEQLQEGEYKEITNSFFVMVARNATNTGPSPVNPLKPADDIEKKILAEGDARQKQRKNLSQQSIFKVKPTEEEHLIIYNAFQRTISKNSIELNKRVLPENCRWMSESYSLNYTISYPENRNAQYTVFGGFLMKKAMEITWLAARVYSNDRPKIKYISDIYFNKPVSVTSFFKMTAYVVYTKDNLMQLMTVCDVLNPISREDFTSNIFYVALKAQKPLPEVLPSSFNESLWYIEGKRKLQHLLDKTESNPAMLENA